MNIQRKAAGLLRTLEVLHEVTGEGNSMARYLLFLGSKHPEPVSFQEVTKKLDINKSQVSRNTRMLHKLSPEGVQKDALDYVDIQFDWHNPRIKLINLNDRGVKAVERVLETLG